jgi:hypothetical protein
MVGFVIPMLLEDLRVVSVVVDIEGRLLRTGILAALALKSERHRSQTAL